MGIVDFGLRISSMAALEIRNSRSEIARRRKTNCAAQH
jgi:hypothetical protein